MVAGVQTSRVESITACLLKYRIEVVVTTTRQGFNRITYSSKVACSLGAVAPLHMLTSLLTESQMKHLSVLPTKKGTPAPSSSHT